MDNIRKMYDMLKDDSGMQDKLMAEVTRLYEAKEVTDGKDAMGWAVKNCLGIDLTREEVDTLFSTFADELSPDDMEKIAGGVPGMAPVVGRMVRGLKDLVKKLRIF